MITIICNYLLKQYPRVVFFILGTFFIFLFIKIPHLIWPAGTLLSWFTFKGLIMYKDFLNFYFPLSTYFILPFLLISNWNLKIEPFISLVIAMATLFLLYFSFQKYLSKAGITISLIFFFSLFYYFTTAIQYTGEAITGLLIILIIILTIKCLDAAFIKPKELLLLGILIGITLFFNQISAPTLSIISFFIILNIFKKHGAPLPYIRVAFFLLFIFFPLLIISLYFLANNALLDFIQNNSIYYLEYAKLARESTDFSALPWNEIILYYLPLVSAFFLMILTKIKNTHKTIFFLLFFSCFVTIPSIIFSVFHRHHFLYTLPLISLLLGLNFDLIIKSKSLFNKLIYLFGIIFIFYELTTIILPWYQNKIISSKNNTNLEESNPEDDMSKAVAWVKKNTSEKDTLLVAGDSMFYLMSNRLPSNKYFVVLPWHYKPLEQSVPIIKSNRPIYWVVGDSYLQRISSSKGWNSPEISEFIKSELMSCYLKVATFGDFKIWRKICN